MGNHKVTPCIFFFLDQDAAASCSHSRKRHPTVAPWESDPKPTEVNGTTPIDFPMVFASSPDGGIAMLTQGRLRTSRSPPSKEKTFLLVKQQQFCTVRPHVNHAMAPAPSTSQEVQTNGPGTLKTDVVGNLEINGPSMPSSIKTKGASGLWLK